jgi:SAM-dependent methyltransferase
VDIGSDVKMIGVLSAFVDIEFFDYRPLAVELDGLVCKAGNITALPVESGSIQSLSCQHVIEHIGLGRYGDPLNPDGSIEAAKELERILKSSGKLYLSLPVGRERVCFNAHRVYAPSTVVEFFSELKMLSFSYVDDNGVFFENKPFEKAEGCDYACGMYVFEKH